MTTQRALALCLLDILERLDDDKGKILKAVTFEMTRKERENFIFSLRQISNKAAHDYAKAAAA